MRYPVLALLLALPLMSARAATDSHEHAHAHAVDNPAAHEHGAARLDLVVEGQTLLLQFDSPAANLLGFEHAPATAAERQALAQARAALEQPLDLFGVPSEADCTVAQRTLSGALFEAIPTVQTGGHSDIQASYTLQCSAPQTLDQLDLGAVFRTFAQTSQVHVQAIGPLGQQAAVLDADAPRLMLAP